MPRLFTGLEIPRDIALELSLLQGGIPGARWIDKDNFHITLRFIGDISGELAMDLDYALQRLSFAPFGLQLAGLDYFGGNKPHSLHVKVAGCDSLTQLQFQHERLCQRVGLKPDGRKFTPHVTLARLRGTTAVHSFVEQHNSYASRQFTVERFVMYSARQSRGGGPYVVERSYGFDLAM